MEAAQREPSTRTDGRSPEPLTLTAFRRLPANVPRIVVASRWREWMNATPGRFANRCLPLLIANEAGWMLLNPIAFEAVWDGEPDQSSLKIEWDGDSVPRIAWAQSLFGHGILTWTVPYLFRTPPGFNLLARGPANAPKDGISALEGIVETDWSTATFTMNWKLTRPGHRVRFEEEEPFCMIVPQRRGELESFEPEVRHVRSDPETARRWKLWHKSREQLQVRKFLGRYSDTYKEDRAAWEQDYFRGRHTDGEPAAEHQTKLRLRQFVDRDI